LSPRCCYRLLGRLDCRFELRPLVPRFGFGRPAIRIEAAMLWGCECPACIISRMFVLTTAFDLPFKSGIVDP
jgi:hypothetical protein